MRIGSMMAGWLLGIVTCMGKSPLPPDSGATPKPSVLLLVSAEQRLDFTFLKALHAQGLALDYCPAQTWSKEVPSGKLLERLRRYNVVVMVQAGESDTFFDKEGMAKFVKTLAQYADEGGGLLLMPNTITWDVDWNYPEFARLNLETFGASYLLSQWVLDANPDNNAQGGLHTVNYAWTDNVAPHDVTKDVAGVWYGTDTYRNFRCTTLALEIKDPAWTVVLKGAKTASTMSYDDYCKARKIEGPKSNMGGSHETVSEKRYASEPPLMAVRAFGKGRAAYLPMDDITIWCGGYRHLHGGGRNDDSPGCSLGGTLKGRTSGLEKLIINTITWLAQPAMTAGSPGGYVQDLSRLAPFQPAAQPPINWDLYKFNSELGKDAVLQGKNLDELKRFAALHGMADVWELWKDIMQWGVLPHKGLIGARSTLSDGKSSVAEMAAAARESNLDFLIFLERFDLLTKEKLETLQKECAKASDDKLLVLPGYTIDDNRNHSLYVFGPKLEWPAAWLTPDGKQFNMAATEKDSGLTKMIDFGISKIMNVNDMGYYNFTAPAPDGQVRGPMCDVRLYSSVGLYYYDGGKLIEGPEQNYAGFRDVNDLALCIKPYVIDIVRDPAEFASAVKDHALTRVLAKDPKDVMNVLAYGFRHREASVSVGAKAGPEIRQWACQNTDYTCLPLRSWVTPNYRWRIECAVAAEDGIDTLEIWDGLDLAARIKVNGDKRFHHIFELSHRQQQQLMLVVTDMKGRKSHSAAVQDGNHVQQHYFCGDRFNGALYHGPYGDPRMSWGRHEGRIFEADGYDGFPGANATLWFHTFMPELDLGIKESKNHGFGGAHCYIYLWNEEASVHSTTSDYSYPLDEKIIHAWYTYGPLLPRECTGTVGYKKQGCGNLVLQENFVTLKNDGKINFFPSAFIDNRAMGVIPGNGTVFTCSAGPKSPIYSFNIPGQLEELNKHIDSDFRIGKGGFAACHGTQAGSGSCGIFVLDDYQRKLLKGGVYPFVAIETIPAGTEYKKGDKLTAKTLGVGSWQPIGSHLAMGGYAPEVNGGWWYQRIADWLGLDGTPDIKLALKAGQQMPPLEGFCDIDLAKDGYADMTFSPDTESPLPQLGVRLKNANDRWTMMRYQPKLPYVDSVKSWFLRYSVQVKREVEDGLRPLGSRDNIGYLTIDLPKPGDDPLHVLAGHPVTASDPRVFVWVTALGWKPYTYAVTVNNPTDETLTVTLKPGLPLPNFPFTPRTLTLKPGELMTIPTAGR